MPIEVKRGQLARSEEALAQRYKWSKNKLRKFLKLLEKGQQIKLQRSNIINLIEIINYDSYQKVTDKRYNKKTTEGTTKGTHTINIESMNDEEENNNKYLPLAEGLVFVLSDKLRKSFSEKVLKLWEKEIKKLVEIDLKNREDPFSDVLNAIQGVSDNYGKEFFPVIQSGGSLREKFSKIEDYLQRIRKLSKADQKTHDNLSTIFNTKLS